MILNIEIRQAKEDEIDILLEFERGIIAAERPFDPTLKSGEIHYYDLKELIRSPHAVVLVALMDGKIIASGFAKILHAQPYQKFETYAYLGFMYVNPQFRGKGINKLLLNDIISWSKDKNITELSLEVYDENIAAKTAYLKAGFKPNLLKMRMGI